jgi:hypothetical protein
MSDALATLDELAPRLPFVMDPDEEREAAGALEDLSDDARHYGSHKWTAPINTPRQVIRLILKAAARHMKNPDGYTVSRAGDESVSWGEKGDNAGSAFFTPDEIKRLNELGGFRSNQFFTVNTFAYQSKAAPQNVGLVPSQGSSEPFQLFSTEEPW